MMFSSGRYFGSAPLSGVDYAFIIVTLIVLVLVGRYVYTQYHKENEKLPPLEGENIKRKVSVDDLYPKDK